MKYISLKGYQLRASPKHVYMVGECLQWLQAAILSGNIFANLALVKCARNRILHWSKPCLAYMEEGHLMTTGEMQGMN